MEPAWLRRPAQQWRRGHREVGVSPRILNFVRFFSQTRSSFDLSFLSPNRRVHWLTLLAFFKFSHPRSSHAARWCARCRGDGRQILNSLTDPPSGVGGGSTPAQTVPATVTEAAAADRSRADVDRLIARRKREILERECFGLVEFVEPGHGLLLLGIPFLTPSALFPPKARGRRGFDRRRSVTVHRPGLEGVQFFGTLRY